MSSVKGGKNAYRLIDWDHRHLFNLMCVCCLPQTRHMCGFSSAMWTITSRCSHRRCMKLMWMKTRMSAPPSSPLALMMKMKVSQDEDEMWIHTNISEGTRVTWFREDERLEKFYTNFIQWKRNLRFMAHTPHSVCKFLGNTCGMNVNKAQECFVF